MDSRRFSVHVARRWRGALIVLLSVGASWTVAHQLRAQVASAVEDVAARVEALASTSPGGPLRALHINGASFDVHVQGSAESIAAVVQAAAESCRARTVASSGWASVGPDPVVRSEAETSGIVACLVPEAPWGSASELAAALVRFGETGDVRDLGRPELLIARRSGARTAVLRLVASSPMRLEEMFPAGRDVPGSDPAELPRPPRARRVLAAEEPGAEPGIVGYRSDAEPAEVAAMYRDVLVARGWSVSEPSGREAGSLFAQKGNRSFVVSISPEEPGSTVALIRLR